MKISKQTTGKPRRGVLIVSDLFPKGGESEKRATHGELAVASAQQLGLEISYQEQVAPGADGSGQRFLDYSRGVREAESTNDVAQATDTYISQMGSAFVNRMEKAVREVSDDGYQNSVLNLSHGTDRSNVVDDVYRSLAPTWTTDTYRDIYEPRLAASAPLFGVEASKLVHEDPKIHAPERRKLIQAIVDRVDSVLDSSPELALAQESLEEAVQDFEKDNNSVVIAAGNSGSIVQSMSQGEEPYDLPEDFDRNLSEVESVTSVGAYLDYEGKELLTSYTSRGPGVDVYSKGSVEYRGTQAQGTSFAAPQVGAIMTALHLQNPEATSAQIESLMLAEFSSPRESWQVWDEQPVIEPAEASRALVS